MTAVDHAELKRLAEGATPGPWGAADWDDDFGENKFTIQATEPEKLSPGKSSIWPNGVRCLRVAETIEGERPPEDAAFIAAANPAVVLALLSEIEGLKAERDDKDARLEYLRTARDAAHDRAQALYMALAEVLDQVETYPLDDNATCMCGSPVEGHNVGSGHAPVSQADHALSLIVEGIEKALGCAALPLGTLETDGRPDDYEGPDAGMHDTEIVENEDV